MIDSPERGIRLFSFRGTTVHVEISFLILVALFVFLDLERGDPAREALLWAPLLLLSVLLHEIGHAAAIALLGFGPSEIRLASLGGVTLNRRNASPLREIVISVAGPLMSFMLSGIGLLVRQNLGGESLSPFLAAFLPKLIGANLIWGIFNLLPIFPLDGGHVVQQIARAVARPITAARVSAITSLFFSLGLVVLAIWARQIFLVLFGALFAFQNYQRLSALRQLQAEEKEQAKRSDSEEPDA